MNDIGKLPAQDLDIEEAVLGTLLIDKDAILECADKLRPDAFYKDTHRIIYTAILDMWNDGKQIDILTLTSELRQRKVLSDVGGAYYITLLTDRVASSLNLPTHIAILTQLYAKRETATISGELYNLAFDESTDGLELIDRFGTEAIKISNIIHIGKSTSIVSVCDRVVRKMEDIRSGNSTLGIPTGLCIDELTNGLCAPDLTIIAARPGMGKTALAITMMLNICSNGSPAAFFSLEMSEDQLLMRMLSVLSGLPHSMIRNPASLSELDMNRAYTASQNIKQMPMYIDDTAGISIQNIRSRAIRMKKEFNIQALFVDYLQLVSPGEMQRGRSRDNELGVISKGLKHIAKELNIPVVALSQLSREVEKRGGRPKLSDLRESGNIEQDADNVIFLHQPNRMEDIISDSNVVDIELVLEKQRSGSTGIRHVEFVRHSVTFRNPSGVESYGQPLNTEYRQEEERF